MLTDTSQATKARLGRLPESGMGESMITLRDVAHFCQVTYRCVQQWRAAGILPPPDFCCRRVVRWNRSTIERFVKSRSAAAART